MKRKSLPALLLSLAVIAGAMTITTDAYAQTNTERLIQINERTAETHDTVSSLSDALGSLSDAIQALTNSLTGVMDTVESTSMKVDAVDSKIAMLSGGLEAQTAQFLEFVTGLSGDISQISGDLSQMSQDLSDVSQSVDDNSAAIQDLNNNVMDSLGSAVTSINDKVDQNAAQITEIKQTLVGLNNTLASISATLGVVEEKVEVTPVSAFPEPLTKKETTTLNTVKLSNFLRTTTEQPDNNVYNYPFDFSCADDVVIQSIGITVPDGDTATEGKQLVSDNTALINNRNNPFHVVAGANADPNTTPPTNTVDALIKVNGETVLDNKFDVGGNAVGLLKAVSYDTQLLHLLAGSTVKFTSMIDLTALKAEIDGVGGENSFDGIYNRTTANNATDDTIKADDANLFSIEIEYIETGDAECRISLPVAADRTLDQTLTVLATPTLSASGITSTFEATIDCNDEPTTFKGPIYVIYRGPAKDQAPAFTNVDFNGDSKVSIPAIGTLTNDFPKTLKLTSGNLVISGTTLNISEILLQFTYDTVKGNTCSVQ